MQQFPSLKRYAVLVPVMSGSIKALLFIESDINAISCAFLVLKAVSLDCCSFWLLQIKPTAPAADFGDPDLENEPPTYRDA